MEDSTSPLGSPLAATERVQTPPNITEQATPAAENPEAEQVLLSPPTEEKPSPGKDEEEGNSVAELSKEEVPAPEEEVLAPEASAPELLEASASEICEVPDPAPADVGSEAPASDAAPTPAPDPAPAPADASEPPAPAPATEASEPPAPAPATEALEPPAPALATETTEPPAPASVNGNGNAAEANGEAENRHTAPEDVVAEKPQEKKEEESMPPEADSVVVPPQWHAKPCLHVTSIGGFISQEFNMLSQASGRRTD